MKRIGPVILVLLLAGATAKPSELLPLWVASYDGPGSSPYADDQGIRVVVDADGSVYASGMGRGVGTYTDYTTIKYDKNGARLWVAIYDGTGHGSDRPTDMTLDAAGNVYVTGMSEGADASYDYATVKYTSEGEELWAVCYDSGVDRAYAIAVDDSGNVYVTGSSGPMFESDYVTIKYDPKGNERWIARYDGPRSGDDWAYGIAVSPTGTVFVVGTADGPFGNATDIITVAYHADGSEDWAAGYNGPASDEDVSYGPVVLDESGALYVIGHSNSPGNGRDWIVLKYSSHGSEIWRATYAGPGGAWDMPHDLCLTAEPAVYVTGTESATSSDRDYLTARLDTSGVFQWTRSYAGPGGGRDEAFRVSVDRDGWVWVTGLSVAENGAYDCATVGYSPDGVEDSVSRYDGPASADDIAWDIATDSDGSVIITGVSGVTNDESDFITIKYAAVCAVPETAPSGGTLTPFVPNPIRTEGKSIFGAAVARELAGVRVYGLSGRVVKTLYEGAACLSCPVSWDATDQHGRQVAAGVYFVRLDVDGSAQATQKVVVIR